VRQLLRHDSLDKMKIFGFQLITFVVGQIIFSGCGQPDKKTESLKADSTIIDKRIKTDSSNLKGTLGQSVISLDSFTDIPPEIEGCSCYFSESEEKHNLHEYIFVADFDSTAFISVDSRLLKLKLVSTGREPMTFGDYDHKDSYESDKYKITVDIKYKDSPKEEGDEVWLNTGTITIEDKDGRGKKMNFYGACGC
jgi:hypothetical protein